MGILKHSDSRIWKITALAFLSWLLCTLVNTLLSQQSRLPAQFVDLIAPSPLRQTLSRIPQPWPLLVAVLWALAIAVLTFVLLRWVRARTTRPGSDPAAPGFAATWLCVGFASLLTTLLASGGLIIAQWPPARLAWIFQDLQPALAAAAYWACLYGWIPAAVPLLGKYRRGRRPRAAAPRIGPGLLASVTVCVLLIGSVVLARTAGLQANQTPTPVATPTPSYVIYGSPDRSAATVSAGPNWCAGEQVSLNWGEPEAATGHRALVIELRNDSETSCVLNSYPDVAFDDSNGSIMDVLVVHGGSFMTQDHGVEEILLEPGDRAVSYLGWNAMAGAGDTRVGSLLVAPYAGALRQKAPADLDIINGGALTISAWEAAAMDTEQPTRPPSS